MIALLLTVFVASILGSLHCAGMPHESLGLSRQLIWNGIPMRLNCRESPKCSTTWVNRPIPSMKIPHEMRGSMRIANN